MTPSGNPSHLMVVVDKLETKCPGDRLSLANGNTSIPLQGKKDNLFHHVSQKEYKDECSEKESTCFYLSLYGFLR